MNISKNAIVAGVGLIAVIAVLIWFFVPHSGIIEQEALERIKALPEVQTFVSNLEENGKSASFRVEDRGGAWSVQAYEIVVQNGESHTATFNWYIIDKKTGAVTKEFE